MPWEVCDPNDQPYPKELPGFLGTIRPVDGATEEDILNMILQVLLCSTLVNPGAGGDTVTIPPVLNCSGEEPLKISAGQTAVIQPQNGNQWSWFELLRVWPDGVAADPNKMLSIKFKTDPEGGGSGCQLVPLCGGYLQRNFPLSRITSVEITAPKDCPICIVWNAGLWAHCAPAPTP